MYDVRKQAYEAFDVLPTLKVLQECRRYTTSKWIFIGDTVIVLELLHRYTLK